MNFERLEVDGENPKKKFINNKKFFNIYDNINEEYIKEAFEFSYLMTFARKGQHRNYRSGGVRRRKNGEIFANTFQGKLCEFALYQILNEEFDINKPDLSVSKLGVWDSYDFKINDSTVSVKSTKFYGQLLLLEVKDWDNQARYIPNGNEHYDFIIMIRLNNDIERIMKSNRLYYSQSCEKSKLWSIINEEFWAFDVPSFITYEELKFLIDNEYIIFQGDLLNGKTKMDATNYYCYLNDMHTIDELNKFIKQ